ncbi:hypothetical protein PanWU01x14_241540, partial [Parasponia andersonii]
ACFRCGSHEHKFASCPLNKISNTTQALQSAQSSQGIRPTGDKGGNQRPKAQGRVNALKLQDAQTSNDMVTDTILVSSKYAYVSFDLEQ